MASEHGHKYVYETLKAASNSGIMEQKRVLKELEKFGFITVQAFGWVSRKLQCGSISAYGDTTPELIENWCKMYDLAQTSEAAQ